ncbi:hypothetical protein POBR111598_10000 [Polynucleobacter brandtiae]
MFPPTVLIPVPVKVTNASGVVLPIATVLIVPAPAAIVKPNALSTTPRVTLPFPELVVMVLSAAKPVVLDVPFKSTAPLVTIFPLIALLPVPCKVSELRGVAPTAPSAIAPLPLLIVRPYAPAMSDKLIAPFALDVNKASEFKVTDPV